MESLGFFSSLRVKIGLYILLGAIIFSSVILYFIYSNLHETLASSVQEQGRIMAESIEEQSAEPLIENDAVGLRKIVEKYRHYDSNEYILIVDADYNIVADTYNGAIPAELTVKDVYQNFNFSNGKSYNLSSIDVAGREVYDIRFPVKEGLLGFIRVGIKKSFVDESAKAAMLQIAIVIGIGTLIAILMAILVITVQVTRPVGHLTYAAKEISMGNFNTVISVSVNNELRILAEAIDRMKESLKNSLERLKSRSTIERF